MILKILTVLTLANSIAATSKVSQFQNLTGVDPNSLQCDPKGLKPLLLPHHEDCDKFYMCTHGQEVLFSCPEGTVFDFERQTCNWPRDVECILRDDQLKDSSEEESEEDDEDGSGGGSVEWGDTDDGTTDEPESASTPKPHPKPPKPDHKPSKPDDKPPKPDHKPSKPDHKPPKPDQKPSKPNDKPSKPDQKPPKPDNKPQKPEQKPNDNHSEHHKHHGNRQRNSSNIRNDNNRNRNRNDQRRKSEKKLKCDDPKNAGRQEAHSTNCQRYWRCEDGKLHQLSCSDGLFYNRNTGQCDHEGNVKCDTNNDELNNEYIVA